MKEKSKKLKIVIISICAVFLLIGGVYASFVIRYSSAMKKFNAGNYEEAKLDFSKIQRYKDSGVMVSECDYKEAQRFLEGNSFDEAKALFITLSEYKDSKDMVLECDYRKATVMLESQSFDEAKSLFNSIRGYKEADILISECDYRKASEFLSNSLYEEAKNIFVSLSEYKDSKTMINECDYQIGMLQVGYEKSDAFMAVMNLVPAYKSYCLYAIWEIPEYEEYIPFYKTDLIEYPQEAIDVPMREFEEKFDMYPLDDDDMQDCTKEEEFREYFSAIGAYEKAENEVKELTKEIGCEKFYQLNFEDAKKEFDKYPDDELFAFFSKTCEMEIIRDLILNKNYDEAGTRLAAIINDEQFLTVYYGPNSMFDNEDYQTTIGEKMVKPLLAKHSCVDGVMHQIIRLYVDGTNMDYFIYGLFDREDTKYGFIHYKADGTYISNWLYEPQKRWK